MRVRKQLYFIRGVATKAQLEFAYENNLYIRDALAYVKGDFIEKCDFVLGELPQAYAEFKKHDLHSKALKLVNIDDCDDDDQLTPEQMEALKKALDNMDHGNEKLWNKNGDVNQTKIQKLLGFDITKDHVNTIYPGFKRKEVTEEL